MVCLDVFKRAIDDGAMPGATISIYHRGEKRLDAALGTLDYSRPATTETIYDLASLTKPMATGASVLTLVEQGRLTLTATLPEFFGSAADHHQDITIKHLLTHTSGIPAWIPCYENGLGHDAAIDAILKLPTVPVGTKYEYSCLNFILLHKIVEMVSNQSLNVFAHEHIFAPLGMKDTMFLPDERFHHRIAPTMTQEGPRRDQTLIGIVHDGNACGIGGVSGNAGLFGTAADVATYGEALRTGKIFGSPTRARIFENQVNSGIGAHTFLFFAMGNGYCPSGDLLSPHTVGHSGYTGTLLTIDPEHSLVVALLTNAVYGDGKASFLTYRRKFLNALAAEI